MDERFTVGARVRRLKRCVNWNHTPNAAHTSVRSEIGPRTSKRAAGRADHLKKSKQVSKRELLAIVYCDFVVFKFDSIFLLFSFPFFFS